MNCPDPRAEDRKTLRQQILTLRHRLSAVDRQHKSGVITASLLQLPEVIEAKTLFLYVNFRGEVETMPLIRKALAQGKTVCVPLTDPENSRLLAFQITDPQHDLRPGYCGIPEPDPEKLAVIAPRMIETILLPGSVFDHHGGRLGYGGGFYDRFLATEAPKARRVGVAFELQVVNRLPLLPHDQPLHCLVTEDAIRRF